MQLAQSNFYLLRATGPKVPDELERRDAEQAIAVKLEVLAWLRRSLRPCRRHGRDSHSGELQRFVTIEGERVKVDGMYLRLLCHENEPMGQLVAYGRVPGVVPS